MINIKKLRRDLRAVVAKLLPAKKQPAKPCFESLTGRPLEDLAGIAGISVKEARAIAKRSGLPYKDLLKYYRCFRSLPDPDRYMVLRHFGIDALIRASIPDGTLPFQPMELPQAQEITHEVRSNRTK